MRKEMEVILLGGVLLTFIGCGGEPPKPTKIPVPPVAKPAPTPAKALPSSADLKLEPPLVLTFTYDPKGKPDPFKPLVVEKPEVPPPPLQKAPAEPSKEAATPLEKYDLNQIKLVAIVWNIKEPRAMVEDSAGKGYIITQGTNIGKNKGTVTKISSTGVLITEKVETAPGKISMREVLLKLYGD